MSVPRRVARILQGRLKFGADGCVLIGADEVRRLAESLEGLGRPICRPKLIRLFQVRDGFAELNALNEVLLAKQLVPLSDAELEGIMPERPADLVLPARPEDLVVVPAHPADLVVAPARPENSVVVPARPGDLVVHPARPEDSAVVPAVVAEPGL